MKFKLDVWIGETKVWFEDDAKSVQEFMAKASQYTDFPKVCKNSKKSHLKTQHRSPKGFDYYSVVCTDCDWEFKYGQLKDGGGLFVKGWEAPHVGESAAHAGEPDWPRVEV